MWTIPRSMRPVATVPRPSIENTSSTAIKNGDATRVGELLATYPELVANLDSPLNDRSFGTTPVLAAVSRGDRAIIDVLLEEKLPERGKRLGDRALTRMRSWRDRYPQVGDVRGLGAMVAMELVTDRTTREPAGTMTNDVLRYCHTHGLVLLKAGLYDNVIRLLFPLTISEQELDRGLDILEEALSAAPA